MRSKRMWKQLAAMTAGMVLAASLALGSTPVPQPVEENLAKQVRHEIALLPFLSVFDNIEIAVNGYDVTLRGQVIRPTLKTGAERVARKVEGVESVRNEIEVLPLSRFDDQIRLAVLRSVYGSSMLSRYAINPIAPIRIIVRNGNVTLEGVVLTEAEKNVAAIQANGVAGVFSVTNNLRVEKPART
jgi:hyperosmotically inducible periplasmic protein